MTLAEKLTAKREAGAAHFPSEIKEKMRRATDELRVSGILDRALKTGAMMPPFSLPNTKGELIDSDKLLREGNLIVTFYRGVW